MKSLWIAAAGLGLSSIAFGACTTDVESGGNRAGAGAADAGVGATGNVGSGVGGSFASGGIGAGVTGVGGVGTTGMGGGAGTAPGLPEDGMGEAGEGGAPPDLGEPANTNPFVTAVHDPLSTFAADVDTASYDIFRQYAQLGQLPQSGRVRLEEFVNYFSYDYPAPAEDSVVPFSLALAAAQSPFAEETTLLRVGIQGKEALMDKLPTNLVFLVDVSGSMSAENKLPLVKQVLTETLGVLDPTDTVSIVTYAGTVGVALEPTPVADAPSISAVINGLTAGGGTAGGDGMALAYAQAEAGFLEDGLNHIIMCTDGDFNVGPYTTAEIVALVEEKRLTGVTLTMLGFGLTSNDQLMEEVSNAGNGVYGAITDSLQATRYVEERMLSTLVHIAKDVKIQVEFNPEYVEAYRLLGYENRAIADEDFRDDVVDAGEIGSGHRVTALYELVLSGGSVPSPEGSPPLDDGTSYSGPVEVSADDLVLVKIRYKQPGATETDPADEVALSLAASNVASAASELDADFRWAVAVAGLAEVLKQSPYVTEQHAATISGLLQGSADSSSAERLDLLERFAEIEALLP